MTDFFKQNGRGQMTAGMRASLGLLMFGMALVATACSTQQPVPDHEWSVDPSARIAAGAGFSCALDAPLSAPSGEVVCWGDDHLGQSTAPDGQFVALAAAFGASSICGVRVDASLRCWGAVPLQAARRQVPVRRSGILRRLRPRLPRRGHMLGTGTLRPPVRVLEGPVGGGIAGLRTDRRQPRRLLGTGGRGAPRRASSPPCHWDKTMPADCAPQETSNAGDRVRSTVPTRSQPARSCRCRRARSSSPCGVRSAGDVECWGPDDHGRTPPPSGDFVSVATGAEHACGLQSDGSVVCWGHNPAPLLDAPDDRYVDLPDRVTWAPRSQHPGADGLTTSTSVPQASG